MIKLCHPPIRLLLTVCPVDMGRIPQHLPPMPPVLQMELDIGYLVKAAPLAPAVGQGIHDDTRKSFILKKKRIQG